MRKTLTIEFKIALIECHPIVWRRFKITDDFRLDRFHQVIQIVMGWTNSHLHEFKFKLGHYGMVDDYSVEYAPQMIEETKVYLKDLQLDDGDVLTYRYDYGDNWVHVLYVEYVHSLPLANPVCLEAAWACPPEDCGGSRGYKRIQEAFYNKDHEEHESDMEWLPPNYHPEKVSVPAINKELEKFGAWHRKFPRKRSTPWHQID